ncbi:MAG: anthranilate phosphoribosyltransferase [Gemmatimonadetes bacterium]|nr:anthranilate phosphoribosyltransferase [Gemmatimonadota bacterium]
MKLQQLIHAAMERPLSAEEAGSAFDEIMEGGATPVQIAALLVGIRMRGAAAEEVAGGVQALRRAMVPVLVRDGDEVVDTCGTGGGKIGTFNISTAAAFVAAGVGVRVAKHGNRSFTSRCGSADLLESFGVPLDLTPEQEAAVLESAGIVFMFAPHHHPAMRHVAPVRKELGVPTIMNVLGPLTNPAGARRQVVGVADPALLPLVASALRVLGHTRALVVHGEPGMDELSPMGPTRIIELRDGELTESVFDPRAELGWEQYAADGLAGAGPEENAELVEGVLKGEIAGAPRAAVVLNAAAALLVAGRVDNLPDGVLIAQGAVSSGAGWDRVERLRDVSRRV